MRGEFMTADFLYEQQEMEREERVREERERESWSESFKVSCCVFQLHKID